MADSLADQLASTGGPAAQWNTVAPGWARQRAYIWDISQAVGNRLVQLLDPAAGATVLELAAGPGDTGFEAAQQIGPAGRLISTDVAPEMVAAAEDRGRQLGLANVEYRVVDGQAIDLPDASVDGVLCRWGYMLMPDPARALRESCRVLAPKGRLAFAIWAEADANPWGTAVGRALLALELIEQPDPDAPGPFRLGDADRVRRLVTDAGFSEPDVEDLPVMWHHDSLDDYWAVTADLSFLLTTAARTLDPGILEEVRKLVGEELRSYTGDDGHLAVPGLCRAVLAGKA